MLKLTKETLAELTSDQMASVVGGLRDYRVSAPTGCLTLVIHHPDSCVAASCITND